VKAATKSMDALRDLASSLKETHSKKAAKAVRRASTLQRFLEQDTTTDTGAAWSLTGHEPFRQILDSIDNILRRGIANTEIALLKAEQIGATHSVGLGPALFMASEKKLNVGYFLPTDVVAGRMGRTRLKNMIKRSPYLAARMKDRELANQTMLKEFDGSFLYLFGLDSISGAVTTPLDVRIYDEVDLLPAENTEWSEGRTAHSATNLAIWLSAGYAPGAGIDQHYQAGTQHRWLVDCATPGCRKGICLEEIFLDSWPDCVTEIRGKWNLACPSCHHPLDVIKRGRWVAKEPKAKKLSFRLSQLSMPAMSVDQIVDRYEKARKKKSKLAKFKASVLALPDAGALQPFNDVTLGRMQSGQVKRLRRDFGELPRYSGLDTGDTCHFVCYERYPDGEAHLVCLAEIDVDKADSQVWELIGALGVRAHISDKKPHTGLARGLAYRDPRRVFVQDFADNQPLHLVEEDHAGKKYSCAKVDRDDSLDEMCDEFADDLTFLRIPDVESDPLLATFTKHLKNLRKEESRDAKGRIVYKFKRAVENHFGMALNSARIAEQIAPPSLPFERDAHNPFGDHRRSRGLKGAFC